MTDKIDKPTSCEILDSISPCSRTTLISLADFPPPPQGKRGWPWTEAIDASPPTMPSGMPWPRISIVTPSYNQGQFLEETIRSVLLQNYPNLEYIVLDGGSTDNSVELIRKYESWLSHWVSEKDGGQVAAINRGFHLSTGSIVNWLNSDDIFLKGALHRVAEFFDAVSSANILIGERFNITEHGDITDRQTIGSNKVTRFQVLYMGRWPFYQESVFFRKEIWSKVGGLSEKYYLLFDFDFFLRCLRHTNANTLHGVPLGCWRHHSEQKITPKRENLLSEEMAAIYHCYRSKWVPQLLIKILWSIGRRTVRRHDRFVTEASVSQG